jgi:8-oxo-dGTP diphosphatase
MERPIIGVAGIIVKEQKILLGKRKSELGKGTWGFPGGKLEFNETLEACLNRELLEETSLIVPNCHLATFTNDIFEKEKAHYVTLYLRAYYESGEPKIMEPDKCEKWEWFYWCSLPRPLFLPIENLLKQGYDPTLP